MSSYGMNFLFFIWSGVLQGCPLSATLFLMCVNPFLINFDLSLSSSNGGVVRACADDIGAALSDHTFLKQLFEVFSLAKQIANLQLKPKKCNIIPVNEKLSDELVNFLRRWLQDNIPEWSDFQIVPFAKYLGFFMGPSAQEVQWANTVGKWDARSRDIANSRCGPSVAAFRYNFTAVPVLGYKAQLLVPPEHIHLKERFILHRIFHSPPNSF